VTVLLFVVGIGALAGAIALMFVQRRAAAAGSGRLAEGAVVTLTGTVRAVGDPLIAPLSARTCVLYESFANMWRLGEQGIKALDAQLADKKMVPFALETSLGTVLVDSAVAELELLPRPVFPRRVEREAAFLRAHGHDAKYVHSTDFEEITIDPGALVAVQGIVLIVESEVRLVGNEDQPLTIGPPRRTVVSDTR
jgi:hypothetical protein